MVRALERLRWEKDPEPEIILGYIIEPRLEGGEERE